MDKEAAQQEIIDSVASFADEYPSTALALLTGMFVGLLEHEIKVGGCDPSMEIRINSQGRRDITVHSATNEPASP